MITHNMRIKQPYFDMIRSGEKIFELRLYDDKRSKIKPGDRIIFSHTDKNGLTTEFPTEVLGLVRARNFNDLFKMVFYGQCGFNSIEQAITTMEQFYPKDAQRKFGVVAIVIKGDRK